MRVLFVGHAMSLHILRWLEPLYAQNQWELFFFSTQHGLERPPDSDSEYWFQIHRRFHGKRIQWTIGENPVREEDEAAQLVKYIGAVKPDLIHSFVVQGASHLVLKAKEKALFPFPRWITTSMGSDLYFFGRQEKHAERVKKVMAACDFHFAECPRDVGLAARLGFKGDILDVVPGAGGLDLERCRGLWGHSLPSKRSRIIFKGYQSDLGRALIGLEAIEKCRDVLGDIEIEIFGAAPMVREAALKVAERAKLKFKILPWASHDDHLGRLGKARVYLGLSLSDGICMSCLEAMAMGAFPIQSDTACTETWFENAIGGFRVPPEQPEEIAACLRKALTDDDLVNTASVLNYERLKRDVDRPRLTPRIVRAYEVAAGAAK